MNRIHRALWAAAILAAALFPALALGANVNVNANVAGFGNVQIGSIDVQTGVGGNTDRIDGKFTFDAPFGFLDDWYDFRWINVVTAVTGAASPLFPNGAPAIDPQAPPTNAAEDNEPFYYNTATEWNPNINTQAGPTHTDGVGSTFTDAPQRGAGNGFDFSTYLVARNVTAPGDKKKVGVLAGFTWTYAGTGDTSTFGAAIAIGAGDATAINNAMANSAPANSFPGWSATTDFQLFPCLTPSAWDYVWSDGSQPVVWSPGIWTRDGVEIGRTWPLGIIQPPSTGPSHLSDHITLPAPPNDFHFSVFLPDSNTDISVWYKYPALTPFDFTFPVFTIPDANQLKVMYDFGANLLQVINMATMNPYYNGPIDGFNPAHFGGQYTGDMRHTMLMGIPEPTTFVLVIVACLLIPLRGAAVRS